jgi:DNA-binding MarR family transcriptional regulator
VAEHDQSLLLSAGATDTLKRVIRARNRRSSLFSGELFIDPAWDILLELSLARLEGRGVTTGDLVRLSSVRESIVLRWIDKLVQDGWILPDPEPSGEQGAVLDLSAKAAAGMQKWINELEGRADDRITSLLERIDRGRRDS